MRLKFLLMLLLTGPVANASDLLVPEQLEQKPLQAEVNNSYDRVSQLSYVAQNTGASVEERVDALNNLASYPSQNALVAVARGLKAQEDEIRVAAVLASSPYQVDYRWRLLSPLLDDSASAVRNAAVINLVEDFEKLNPEQQTRLSAHLQETQSALEKSSTYQSKLTLANTHRWTGNTRLAQDYYAKLLKSDDNKTTEFWLNYADTFRLSEQHIETIKILEQGIEQFPDEPNLRYSKALAQVRAGDSEHAVDTMLAAATLAETNSYFWYLHGVMQTSIDSQQAIQSFEKAYLISGAPEQLYALCEIYSTTHNPKLEGCLNELKQVAPANVVKSFEMLQPTG